ncbi:branched-chain amino acid transport system II carrier protein [Bacillus sp. S13(2024)]
MTILYLAMGPFFAIPRSGNVSFERCKSCCINHIYSLIFHRCMLVII